MAFLLKRVEANYYAVKHRARVTLSGMTGETYTYKSAPDYLRKVHGLRITEHQLRRAVPKGHIGYTKRPGGLHVEFTKEDLDEYAAASRHRMAPPHNIRSVTS